MLVLLASLSCGIYVVCIYEGFYKPPQFCLHSCASRAARYLEGIMQLGRKFHDSTDCLGSHISFSYNE